MSRVRLENFEGPFDLLLSLINRRRLDVTEVSLSRHEVGPGSITTSPTSHAPITCGRPRCITSMSRIPAIRAALLRAVFPLGRLVRLNPFGRLEDRHDRGRLGLVVGRLALSARRRNSGVDRVGRRRHRLDPRRWYGLQAGQRGLGCRRRVGREPICGRVGQGQQLAGQLARVLDDAVALGPDPIGLGVQLADPLLGAAR